MRIEARSCPKDAPPEALARRVLQRAVQAERTVVREAEAVQAERFLQAAVREAGAPSSAGDSTARSPTFYSGCNSVAYTTARSYKRVAVPRFGYFHSRGNPWL